MKPQKALWDLISKEEPILRWLEVVPGSPRKGQKKGQENQGEVKELGGPIADVRSLAPPGLPSGSSLGSSHVMMSSVLALVRPHKAS